MGTRAMRILLLLPLLGGLAHAQSVTGAYQFIGVKVQYYDITRDTSLAESDTLGTYAVTASWPSSAAPLYTHELKTFAIGDTMAAPATPDILLTPTGLDLFDIDLSVSLDQSLGTLTIPHDGEGFSTYPTTSTLNCSTFAVVADVTDNGTIDFGPTPVIDTETNTVTWGFGIIQSVIFAWFNPADPAADPTTWPVNWGLISAHYTDDSLKTVDTLTAQWRAIDGVDSDLGVDDAGNMNRFLGIAVLDGDTVTAGALGLNVGDYPIIGGSGIGGVGVVEDINWGYIFDPVGADGLPMNGDEPLQFTGYYFTYNMMLAGGTFKSTFEGTFTPLVSYFVGLGLSEAEATIAAVDSAVDVSAQGALVAIGASPALAAAVGAGLGTTVAEAVAAAIGGGQDPTEAIAAAAAAAVVQALGAAKAAGYDPDDSDHDFNGVNGRLVFEIDNVCIPDQQVQEVSVFLLNRDLLAIDGDDPAIPRDFALYSNYPNPFNPATTIRFDLPARANVEVTVWNLLGQRVRTLYAGELVAGRHSLAFDGRDELDQALPSGVYFYRMTAGRYEQTRKMILLK